MSSFKRIRFFECDPIEDNLQAMSGGSPTKQAVKGRGAQQQEESKKQEQTVSNMKTIQDISVMKMIYLDMFFLFLGLEKQRTGMPLDQTQYFYLTKSLQVKSEFKIHSDTYYIDKFINYQKGLKLLISMGVDINVSESSGTQDSQYVIKIWDFQSLVHNSYIEAGKSGLTGGSVWVKQGMVGGSAGGEQTQQSGESPRMIPIQYNGKPYVGDIKAIRVSKDGAIAAVVLANNEILIYRLLDQKGEFVPEKVAAKPVKILKIKEAQYQEVFDLFIFKKQEGQVFEYFMYVISKNGVLVYKSIEKKEEYFPVSDEQNLVLTPNCVDCDSRGYLIVDAAQKNKDPNENFLKKYFIRNLLSSQALEGSKMCIRLFKDHVVETKSVKNGQQLAIYDFVNQMTVFCNSYPKILCVEVEEDAIYMLTQQMQQNVEKKQLFKLHEMEDNIKIQTLLKKGLFAEAQKIAHNANFPEEIIAEICKEHADNLYEKKQFDESLEQFMKTIGYLNPSYVIQRFIEVPQLPNLIKYLEALIKQPQNASSSQLQSSAVSDYNKDYTALLLNCYVKTKQKDKISELISKQQSNQSDTIFDVETAIEVCRQQEDTLEQAMLLAQSSRKWKLLVQIYIENKKDYQKALQIIEQSINNLKEKVECLQLYGPKLFKEGNSGSMYSYQNKTCAEQIQKIVKDITKALAEYTKQKKFISEQFKSYEIKKNQRIRIEDMLQIFVDDIIQLKDYLRYVIDDLGKTFSDVIDKMTAINLYHRLLECLLYMRQTNQTSANMRQLMAANEKIIDQEINQFIERYDSKLDKNYVLFLFQIYSYSEGVQGCCERLELKQELLNYYIQKGEKQKVLEVCEKYGNQGSGGDTAGDLWIQALIYFRDLDNDDCEIYLEKALEKIGEKNILSPLLILEIVSQKPSIKFKVLKKYLLDRLQAQNELIKKNNTKVESNTDKINKMKAEITDLKTTCKSFNQKECSHCDKKLALPTVHFMCGHTFHDYCVDGEGGKRRCGKCFHQFQEVIEKKEQYQKQQKETEQFFKELNQKRGQALFNVVATYFGRGLFNQIDQSLQEENN